MSRHETPNQRGAGKGGVAVLCHAERARPALPDRERSPKNPMQVPPDYLTYLRGDSQAFGDLTCDDFDRYFDLWPESDIEQFNTEYEVQKLAPGFLAFATNGGGELFAFNQTGQIFELPCIGMDSQYATLLAESWGEFESRIKKTGEQAAT